MQEKEIDTMKILLVNKEKASVQIAHLQFPRAYAQTKNCKRDIFLSGHIEEHTFVFNFKGVY